MNKTAFRLFVFSLLSAVTFCSAKDFTRPMPTKCEHVYTKRMAQFAKEAPPVGGTVLIGDSITQAFPMRRAPKEWKLINRGISGDAIGGWEYQGLYDRLDKCVHQLKPSRLYIAIGVNDIIQWFPGELVSAPQSEMIAGYRKVVQRIQAKNPGVQIYCQSVLPLSKKHAVFNDDVNRFNTSLKALTKELNVTYVDQHKHLLNDKGELDDRYTNDGCHLKPAGYTIILKQMKALFDAL